MGGEHVHSIDFMMKRVCYLFNVITLLTLPHHWSQYNREAIHADSQTTDPETDWLQTTQRGRQRKWKSCNIDLWNSSTGMSPSYMRRKGSCKYIQTTTLKGTLLNNNMQICQSNHIYSSNSIFHFMPLYAAFQREPLRSLLVVFQDFTGRNRISQIRLNLFGLWARKKTSFWSRTLSFLLSYFIHQVSGVLAEP